jgi:hypothetical protein
MKKQTNLDDIVVKERQADFSRDRILDAVAKLIACDDQVGPILILRMRRCSKGVDSH